MDRGDIVVVALTGGPCGGKSSVLDELAKRGSLGGRTLLFVPEAATILINRGLDPADVASFQRAVLGLQLRLEGDAMAQASCAEGPVAIVCDRGTMDGAGYCTPSQFEQVMAVHGCSRDALLARYDAVVHLASAAVGVPDAYTTGNNEARFEDLAGAVEQERKTLDAWSQHPNRVVLGGYDAFEDKLAAAIDAIRALLE